MNRSTCIRQNVCTSLRKATSAENNAYPSSLHTSKRMHFIEDRQQRALLRGFYGPCIRQNVCTSLRRRASAHDCRPARPCIRQNVCTSLRTQYLDSDIRRAGYLHTSKRMHFIEETCRCIASRWTVSCIRQNVCTSLRIGGG